MKRLAALVMLAVLAGGCSWARYETEWPDGARTRASAVSVGRRLEGSARVPGATLRWNSDVSEQTPALIREAVKGAVEGAVMGAK